MSTQQPSLAEQASIRFNPACFCGEPKRRGHWLCQDCFHRLPVSLQRALQPGTAAAYLRAVRELNGYGVHQHASAAPHLHGGGEVKGLDHPAGGRYQDRPKRNAGMPRLGWVGD